MPGLDYNEDYLQTENKIKSLETYNQVKESENQILSQQQSSMEMDAAQTSTPLSQIQNESKRFQRQVKTQLDRLLDLNQLLPENNYIFLNFKEILLRNKNKKTIFTA